MEKDKLLCWKCHKLVPYSVDRRKRVRTIGGKDYEYQESFGICDICGEEITVPGLADENERILCIMLKDFHILCLEKTLLKKNVRHGHMDR